MREPGIHEPYHRNLFEITFKTESDITYPALTEYSIEYKIENNIIWIDFEVSQGMLLELLEQLKLIRLIKVNHFDRQGNVFLIADGSVDYMNFSGLSGNYEDTDYMRIKVSFIYKELNLTEHPINDFSVKTIKLI